jgi:hypothetical protein
MYNSLKSGTGKGGSGQSGGCSTEHSYLSSSGPKIEGKSRAQYSSNVSSCNRWNIAKCDWSLVELFKSFELVAEFSEGFIFVLETLIFKREFSDLLFQMADVIVGHFVFEFPSEYQFSVVAFLLAAIGQKLAQHNSCVGRVHWDKIRRLFLKNPQGLFNLLEGRVVFGATWNRWAFTEMGGV